MTQKKPVKKKKVTIKRTAGAKKTARKKVPAKKQAARSTGVEERLRDLVLDALNKAKGEHVITVDVRGQSSLTDFLVIASGRSNRQVKALAEHAMLAMKASGVPAPRAEGLENGDWAVVDGGDVIVHVFRPEVRAYYRLEEIWGLEPPLMQTFRDL